MKKGIHPKWFDECAVRCACGNKFTVGATVPELTVEICSKCHPFYTGQMKYIDTAGRVDAFIARKGMVKAKVLSKSEKRKLKKEKRIERELEKPETLSELRSNSPKKESSSK